MKRISIALLFRCIPLVGCLLWAVGGQAQSQQPALDRANLLYLYTAQTDTVVDSVAVYVFFKPSDTAFASFSYKPDFAAQWTTVSKALFTNQWGSHQRAGAYFKAFTGNYEASVLDSATLSFFYTDTASVNSDTLTQPYTVHEP